MKKIHSYTIIKFSKIFLGVLIGVILLTIIIDFVELTRRLSEKSANLLQIIELTFLKQPLLILDVMPFVILLTAILFLVKLSDNSEITIFKSGGISLKTIFRGPLIVILILSLVEVFLLNPFATFTEKTYNKNISNILSPSNISQSKIDDIYEDMWFKQNQQETPYIFNSHKVILQKHSVEFRDIMLVFLGNTQKRDNVIYAKKAVIKQNHLELSDATQIVQYGNESELIEYMSFPTSLTTEFVRDKLQNNIADSATISIWNILSSIKLLKEMGFSINKQVALLNAYMVKPIFYIYLFLLASIFCIYPPRHQKKGIYIISSMLIGFVSYFALNICYTLAVASKLSIMLAIWFPHILLLFLVLYLLIKKEQGRLI